MKRWTLAQVGERGLIAQLDRFFGRSDRILVPAGDDAAVVAPEGGALVATTDLLFDTVHFSDRTTEAADVGWRAAAANLSDLAAMGATPLGMLVGLGLPPDTEVGWVEGFYEGFTACAGPAGAPILGGDTCRAASRTVAITALGTVAPERVLRRSAARVGDRLVVTGHLGAARAGLEVLLAPERFAQLEPAYAERVKSAHRRPVPRLGVAALIWQLTERAAAMDTSDGLTDAIEQVCAASGCGAVVNLDALPVEQATRAVAGAEAVRWALAGGEDYELLVALDAAAAEALVAALPALGLAGTIVGEVVEGKGVVDQHGCPLAPPDFEHFRSK